MKYVLLIIIVFGLIQWRISDQAKGTSEQKVLIAPSKNIPMYTFGYDSLFSSLMWVRVLQDIDYCEQNPERTPYPDIDKDEDGLDQILERELPEARCKEGWVYQMLDVITDLTPDFHGAYYEGGTLLSVLVDDRTGAHKLLLKSLESFPEDWELHYRAAYHELFEMQNGPAAAELLKKAAEKGGPEWLYSLSAKVYTKFGQAAFAHSVLKGVVESNRGGVSLERVKGQLKKIEEILKNAQESGSAQ